MKYEDHAKMRRLIRRALESGASRLGHSRYKWEMFGSCSNPYSRTFVSRPESTDGTGSVTIAPGKAHTLELEMLTPCRECDNCLKHRRQLWTARARQEARDSPRTWFGTMTLSPENQYLMLMRADRHATRRGWRWEEMTEAQRFLAVHGQISIEITKWLKRVRKQSGSRLRYMIVCEPHKSGKPHYHALVHQCTEEDVVTYRQLSTEWKLGFTKFKLVTDLRQATYLSKYLSKALSARVRASRRYGSHDYGGVLSILKNPSLTP